MQNKHPGLSGAVVTLIFQLAAVFSEGSVHICSAEHGHGCGTAVRLSEGTCTAMNKQDLWQGTETK